MSANQYGLPLTQNITQSIMPVMINSGKVYGFLPMASPVTYSANVTPPSITINGITFTPETVTVAPTVTSLNAPQRLSQYVAYVVDVSQEYLQSWLGFTGFVSNEKSGMYSQWSMPAGNLATLAAGLGTIAQGLKVTLNTTYTPPSGPSNPTASNGTMNWVCTTTTSGFANPAAFFDFNWMTEFGTPISGSNPVRISTVSNPAGGYFKAAVVTSNGQSVAPAGAVIFDTVRILCLTPPPAGSYVFTFAVTDTNNLVTDVTLTLTVVGG